MYSIYMFFFLFLASNYMYAYVTAGDSFLVIHLFKTTKLSRCGGLMCNFCCFLVRLICWELKLWVRLSQGVLARGGDAVPVWEVECLEIRTSSCYFQHAGVGDVFAVLEFECLEIRTSSCYFHHAGVSDVPTVWEVECLEIRTSSCYFQHAGVGDVVAVEWL